MKLVVVILLMALPVVLNAQKLVKDPDTGKYTRKGIVEIDSISKDRLFSGAVEWIALNYRSAKDVVQFSSKEDGKLICKATFLVTIFMQEAWIHHTMILEFKDNKFRYTFTDFVCYTVLSGNEPFDEPMMGRKKTMAITEEKVELTVLSLQAFLKSVKNPGHGW